MRRSSAGSYVLLAALLGCSNGAAPQQEPTPAPAEIAEQPAAEPEQPAPSGMGLSGQHRAEENEAWVPAEYKNGIAKFKDPGVYADGELVGMLKFGELPVPLEPAWYEERASIPFGPGHVGPKYKIVKQRRYRFTDYFDAIGVDVKRIKEVHIYGGSGSNASVIITGAELRKHTDELTFRFGTGTQGKPIPNCMVMLKDGKCPDNMVALAVYVKKTPPTRKGRTFYVDGEAVVGLPYYGEPARGGIRVYLDGRMATRIKRRLLEGDESLRVVAEDDSVHWKFFAFLQSQGVKTEEIAEAWIIHKNVRVRRLSREELESATFTANPQGKGEILFGDERIPTNSIALHTRPVAESDLPVILPEESEGA